MAGDYAYVYNEDKEWCCEADSTGFLTSHPYNFMETDMKYNVMLATNISLVALGCFFNEFRCLPVGLYIFINY